MRDLSPVTFDTLIEDPPQNQDSGKIILSYFPGVRQEDFRSRGESGRFSRPLGVPKGSELLVRCNS